MSRGTVRRNTVDLPLGCWTEHLARKLKAQLEIMWGDGGTKGAEQ